MRKILPFSPTNAISFNNRVQMKVTTESLVMLNSVNNFCQDRLKTGICKTRTGWLRMADADGGWRMADGGWRMGKCGRKNADDKIK